MNTTPGCTCPHCLAEIAMESLNLTMVEKDFVHRLVEANLAIADIMIEAEDAGFDMYCDEIDSVIEKSLATPSNEMH